MSDEEPANEWGYFEMGLAAVCSTLGIYFLGNAVLDYISNGPSPNPLANALYSQTKEISPYSLGILQN